MKGFSVLCNEGLAEAWRIERTARDKARAAIAAFGNPGDIDVMREAATSGDPNVRAQAVPLLLHRNSMQADQLLGQLAMHDKESAVRAVALHGMGESKRTRYADVLLRASKESDRDVRTQALRGLWNMRTERAAARLRAVVKDASLSEMDRKDALFGLKLRKDTNFLQICEWALREDKELAGWALSELRPRRAKPVVGVIDLALELLGDKNPRLRRQGASLLASCEDLRALPYLMKMFRSADGETRNETLEGFRSLAKRLGEWDCHMLDRARTMVTAALKDRDEIVRATAVDTLVALRVPDATKLLLAAFRESSDRVRRAAAAELGKRREPDVVATMVEVLRSNDDHSIVNAAIKCVVGSGHPRARELLFPLLRKDDWEIRTDAAEALLGLGDKRGWSTLAVGVRDRTWDWTAYGRATLIDALAASKDQRAVGILVSALKNYDPDHGSDENMIASCIRGLGKLGDRRAIEPLRRFLENEDSVGNHGLIERTLAVLGKTARRTGRRRQSRAGGRSGGRR
jgi:HEAT repeat protein